MSNSPGPSVVTYRAAMQTTRTSLPKTARDALGARNELIIAVGRNRLKRSIGWSGNDEKTAQLCGLCQLTPGVHDPRCGICTFAVVVVGTVVVVLSR